MNHIYRVIRSRTHGALIAVSELSAGGRRNKRRSARRLAALLSGLLPAALACAAPVGGEVSAGSGTISQSGNTTTIQQNSDRLALNWNSFNIGANESVRFNQPGAHAIALNRVLGQDPSKILGNLSANGQVFILNPNGVLFGNGAQVNVGGLVATTMKLSDSDFMNSNGKYVFTPGGVAGASVVNQGEITANGGYIALLAPKVINEGKLIADGGNVTLAAGQEMTLTLAAHNLLTLSIDQGAVDALAANHHLIQADGGVVLLSSKGQDAVLSGVVNNTGVIQARTVSNQNGEIRLMAHGGTALVDGTLDASATAGGNGGFIDTSGGKVKIADSVQVTTTATHGKTGMWLIDPNDFVIANSGGDIAATSLSSLLGGTNITFKTVTDGHAGNGDIFVNDAVSWNSGNTLTLEAERNINLNAAINAGQGGLTLNAVNTISAPAAVNVKTFTLNGGNWIQNSSNLAAFSAQDFRINSGSFLRAAGGDGSSANAYKITDVYGLQGVGSSAALLAGSYRLMNDIEAGGTAGWNSGAGFVPIGNGVDSFKGNFDGQGHVVANMTINRLAQQYVGLFGQVEGGTLSNIGVIGGSFVGAGYVGPLAGSLLDAHVYNAHGTGNASGNAGGSDFVGGLVGVNYHNSSITKSFATGSVSGINNVGGLVGWNYGQIIQAYASGNVNGQQGVGGLVGLNDGGHISNAYASGAVSGMNGIGGLIGNMQNGGRISNTYASGAVSGSGGNVGGLAGSNTVLIPGDALAIVDASYWNTQTSGQASSAGGEGRTTQEMQGNGGARPTFVGWDFANVWKSVGTGPVFQWHFIPQTGVLTPNTNNPALSESVNAIHATTLGVLKQIADIADYMDSLIKSSDTKLIESIVKDKATIDAENDAFIAQQKAKINAAAGDTDVSQMSPAAVEAFNKLMSEFTKLLEDLTKKAKADSKVDPATVQARIDAINNTLSDVASKLDLNQVAPLDKPLDATATAAKENAQARLEADKKAGAGDTNAKDTALQKFQEAMAKAKAENDAKAAQSAADKGQTSGERVAAATQEASALVDAAKQKMQDAVKDGTDAVANGAGSLSSAARIAAVAKAATGLADDKSAAATNPRNGVRPSLRDVLPSSGGARPNTPATAANQQTFTNSQELQKFGAEAMVHIGQLTNKIAELLGDSRAATNSASKR
ncbi:filamentous hemagglutinin N-terminal domain-containing protein [Herminiimonas glaciei]|uniref:Filamentous hemagglutinin N-terminal domain-containing protein n=1 Tax=Herminiimonas glaciei TaxID=523788 RepID=A0ABW2IB85_9BURK